MPAIHTLNQLLGAVDAGLHDAVHDLAGFGLLDDETGEPPPAELEDVRRAAFVELEVARQAITALTANLRVLRKRHLDRQMSKVKVEHGELRLSLTGVPAKGWLTVGFPPADVKLNLLWGLPFADGAAALVYFALALEHLHYKHEALRVAREVRRVLKPGGVARILVPDLEVYLRAYAAGDERFFEVHAGFWDWAPNAATPMALTMMMAGNGQARGPSEFFGHKMGYDFATIRALLLEAGFTTVERRAYQESPHPELCVDHLSHDAGFHHDGKWFHMFVEAS